ncbi:hypothetical protein GQ53DRAFT_371129 [Thozetella sp. PMI_491]|nr:hypothetical protein GQ53DRAFT_371129 [Thozetella sp. PMI_491]
MPLRLGGAFPVALARARTDHPAVCFFLSGGCGRCVIPMPSDPVLWETATKQFARSWLGRTQACLDPWPGPRKKGGVALTQAFNSPRCPELARFRVDQN